MSASASNASLCYKQDQTFPNQRRNERGVWNASNLQEDTTGSDFQHFRSFSSGLTRSSLLASMYRGGSTGSYLCPFPSAVSHTAKSIVRAPPLLGGPGSRLYKHPLTLLIDSFADSKATRSTTRNALPEMDCWVTSKSLESDGSAVCRYTSTAASELQNELE